MTIEQINVDDCFNIKSKPRPHERFFPTDTPVDDIHIYEPIVYRCPDCKIEIGFKDKDFQKHSRSNFSNLNKTDSILFDRFVVDSKLKAESYIDFYCPTCNKATRIYFSDGYGGRHGDYGVNIDFAIKAK